MIWKIFEMILLIMHEVNKLTPHLAKVVKMRTKFLCGGAIIHFGNINVLVKQSINNFPWKGAFSQPYCVCSQPRNFPIIVTHNNNKWFCKARGFNAPFRSRWFSENDLEPQEEGKQRRSHNPQRLSWGSQSENQYSYFFYIVVGWFDFETHQHFPLCWVVSSIHMQKCKCQ